MNKFSLVMLFSLCVGSVELVQADTILFESASLGPTGLVEGSVAATNVNSAVFSGVRFELTQPVQTSRVGGHFVSASGGNFFGAVVQLDDENDFPDSADLSSADVLGNTELVFPVASDDVFGDLNLALDPGWYALVFGSGLFETNGGGAAPRNNEDIGSPPYVALGPNLGCFNLPNLSADFVNHRFLLTGAAIPEPPALYMTLVAAVSGLNLRRLES